MYQVNQGEASERFKQAWVIAGIHIQSQCREGLNWLRATLNPPLAEHLSFRLGNQLFFIYIEAEGIPSPGAKGLFLEVAKEAGAVPCLFKLRKGIKGFEPVLSGWNLTHALEGSSVNPIDLVSDELIEMTDWEVHDFAVQVVKDYLKQNGKNVFDFQPSPKIDPSIWFEEEGEKCWVVVRSGSYPTQQLERPANIQDIAESCKRLGDTGFFAPVIFANNEDPFDPDAATNGNFMPLYRGHGAIVKFEGLEPI